jgi:hypothetical protein
LLPLHVLDSIINSIANKSKLSLQNCDSGMTDRGEYFDNWMVFKRVKNIAIGNYAIPPVL